MVKETLEDGIQEYTEHLKSLGFKFWDDGNESWDLNQFWVNHDDDGRQIYVGIYDKGQDHDANKGHISMRFNFRSNGSKETTKDGLIQTIFSYILSEAGYSFYITNLSGKNKGEVVKGQGVISSPLIGAHPDRDEKSYNIGKDPMDEIKKDVSYVTSVFMNISDMVSSNFKEYENLISKSHLKR